MLCFGYWVMVNETAIFVQRDYVKWRGVLFLRFLPSLVDESEKIRHLADYLFGNI
jgi:condensin-2 complex subunit D3